MLSLRFRAAWQEMLLPQYLGQEMLRGVLTGALDVAVAPEEKEEMSTELVVNIATMKNAMIK